MTDVLLFHHAQGLTDGIHAFADQLSAAGHQVTVPDLYDGATFDTLDDGVAHLDLLGMDTIIERGRQVAESLPAEIVYGGFSLGVMPAQLLAQTRSGAKGAVLVSGCAPPSVFGGPWPHGVPLQLHAMESDQMLVEDGDLDVARELAATVENAELFLYPGDQHLFADSSLPTYNEKAAALLTRRVIDFLDAVD